MIDSIYHQIKTQKWIIFCDVYEAIFIKCKRLDNFHYSSLDSSSTNRNSVIVMMTDIMNKNKLHSITFWLLSSTISDIDDTTVDYSDTWR